MNRLEGVLRDLDGVSSVSVTLKPGEALVHGPIPETQLRAAIEEAGFEVVAAVD